MNRFRPSSSVPSRRGRRLLRVLYGAETQLAAARPCDSDPHHPSVDYAPAQQLAEVTGAAVPLELPIPRPHFRTAAQPRFVSTAL